MRIRFDHAATARLTFQPGDEIAVAVLTPELETLLTAERVDGVKVAHLTEDDEIATVDHASEEAAVTRRGRPSGARRATLDR